MSEIDNYKTAWTEQEKRITAESRNLAELFERYLKEVGTPERTNRITSLWSHKKTIREELALKKIRPVTPVTRQESPPDLGDILVSISNKIAEANEIQKEQLAQLQGINSGIVGMMELFRKFGEKRGL